MPILRISVLTYKRLPIRRTKFQCRVPSPLLSSLKFQNGRPIENIPVQNSPASTVTSEEMANPDSHTIFLNGFYLSNVLNYLCYSFHVRFA